MFNRVIRVWINMEYHMHQDVLCWMPKVFFFFGKIKISIQKKSIQRSFLYYLDHFNSRTTMKVEIRMAKDSSYLWKNRKSHLFCRQKFIFSWLRFLFDLWRASDYWLCSVRSKLLWSIIIIGELVKMSVIVSLERDQVEITHLTEQRGFSKMSKNLNRHEF